MRGKKILYVASNMQHINNFHLDYIKALRDAGASVVVMARGEGADIDIPFEKKLLSPKNREARRLIGQALSTGDYDAVILNTSLAAFHVRLAMRKKKRPRVLNIVHGYLFSKNVNPIKARILLLAERVTRGKCDEIIVMNREDLEIAGRYRLAGKVTPSRGMGASVREVITPVDNIRREYFPEGSFVMCFVGELSPRKNQEFLLYALRRIKAEIPKAILCLVGDGTERERLLQLAERLGVTESVVLVGNRTDACDFMRASDLYVSASSIEGMPFNIIEALGASRTVLASRIKGHEDIITDGVDGYLYEFGNIEDFVNKALHIYRNGALNPAALAEKYAKYSKESVFPETLRLIEEFCKG
ncbi:MAG: glycosyltransferase [Clostridia bacterium]|nr:glycosyltransferase [Clostridia bacterium]